MLIGSQKNSYNMPTLISRRNHTILTMCLRRSQEIIAQSYTRLVTHNIVAHITLTIRFVLKKTYVACLLFICLRAFGHRSVAFNGYIYNDL